jgi:hypothetical protein
MASEKEIEEIVRWARGSGDKRGAMEILRDIDAQVSGSERNEGLVSRVTRLERRGERQNYVVIGAISGVLILLIALSYFGNQFARDILELLAEIKRVTAP